MPQSRRALTAKQEHWRKHLEACRRGGTTTADYAARHGLDLQQLYTWRSRLNRLGVLAFSAAGRAPARRPSPQRSRSGPSQPPAPRFSAVQLLDASGPSRCELRIRFANGVTVEIENPSTWMPQVDFFSDLASLPSTHPGRLP
ncbi:MAG: hypothetical protein IPK72_08505 [Candidatus Eisenbacteria bacterium]|nr:hypothetical protein [Candidatus Eisenbacteria bacterium]